MSDKPAAQQSRKRTGADVGPGDQTIAEMSNVGSAFLDYYAENGPTTFNVLFEPTDSANASMWVDGGQQKNLRPGSTQVTFKKSLQLLVNNTSGQVKYGWVVLK